MDLARGTDGAGYMGQLRATLPGVLARHQPDLVLYDAGVDVWEGDALGHLELSHADIYQRDLYVIETCVQAGVPIACVIGGGYDRDRVSLARRHALVHRAAARTWDRHRMAAAVTSR